MATSTTLSEHSQQTASAPLISWLVCLSAGLFFFYEFIQMQMFNSISNDLMRDFSLNAEQLGYLSASYLYADVIFLFPAGILLDRFSTRSVILTAMVLCILGTFFFAITHSALFAGLSHFIAGIGNAFCFLSCIRLASRWFPARQMALIIGLIVTMAMIGGMVAQTPLVQLNAWIGWRNALLLNAGLGLVIMAIIWYFVHDYPPSYGIHHQEQQKQLQQLGFRKGIKTVLANSQNWYCGIYTSFLNLPIMVLGALWGNLYLMSVHHLTALEASKVNAMIFLGTIVGGPAIGWISDRVSQRRIPMIIFATLSLIVMLMIIKMDHLSYGALLALFFALGLFTSSQIISYPAIAESNSRMLTSTATGLASVLIMGGAALAQPIFGSLMDLHWAGEVLNNARLYPAEAYQTAMLILPGAFIIGLLMSLLMKETHCRPQE